MRSAVVTAEPSTVARMFNEVVEDLVVTSDGEIRDATPQRPAAGGATPSGEATPAVEAPPARRPAERWD